MQSGSQEESMTTVTPLSVDQLCWHCKPEDVSLSTSDELHDLTDAFGQTRLIEAIEFAMGSLAAQTEEAVEAFDGSVLALP